MISVRKFYLWMTLTTISTSILLAQSTQGLITGQVFDRQSKAGIDGATVIYYRLDANAAGSVHADAHGFYVIQFLSPGHYRVGAQAEEYQPRELRELELPVAARLELNFPLRSINEIQSKGISGGASIPGRDETLNFFGPDVGFSSPLQILAAKSSTLQSSLSYVVGDQEISTLPLQGRDVYTLLVTQPDVTSDAATSRGLGLAVNGLRPSASNFLLDGLENNNYLITGPSVAVAPEAIQEYRVSINNFSAEYGRASGFVANAITRAGTDQFHGVSYFYLKNDVLNANGFQDNLLAVQRRPDKESQPGFVVGGPILKDRLFFSSAYEYFRSRSQGDPLSFLVPTASFVSNYTLPGSPARQLLTEFPAPAVQNGNSPTAPLTIAPPVGVNRMLAMERLDYVRPGGKDRVMGRLLIDRLAEPDFIWSPYKGFVSPLNENTWALGGSYIHSFRANLTNEARVSYSDDDLHWNRPHPEIPTLVSGDGTTLPGSLALYAYKNGNKSWEMLDNLIWSHGRHLVTTGAGLLLRSSDGYLTAFRDGIYDFNNVIDFALGFPSAFRTAIDRTMLPTLQQPDYNRSYRYRQYFLFAQDTYKISSRLTANYGIRYEYYGGPQNTGAVKDALVQLGPGSSLAQQLTTAALLAPGNGGNQQLFGSDKKDFAVRVGASYDLFGSGRTLLRGGYGIFYDRPFDNLWENLRNNDLVAPPSLTLPPGQFNYLAPVSGVPASLPPQAINQDFPDLTLVAPGLRTGYAHSYFTGVQQRFSNNFTAEVSGLGTYGRRLITTDVINRDFSLNRGIGNPTSYNPDLPAIAYRANQGFSDYNALTAVVRYLTSRGMVQGSYTWSHTIDNQSDPLLGDFFNLSVTSIANSSIGRAAFSEQFNPLVDRGNSDFDQRHNLVLLSYWNLPAPSAGSKFATLFRNWTVSELAAFRSGFPYTVTGAILAIAGQGQILNSRANILDSNTAVLANPVPAPGGKLLLNAADFSNAAASVQGNSGRNAFAGPGFYSVDLSVGRSFGLRLLGEAGRLTFRGDAYNAMNHANLGMPPSNASLTNTQTFGVATFGRQGTQSGFPAVSPLNETARQVQLSVKVTF